MIPTEPDITPTYLRNPSKEDFICHWDGKEIVLPSRVITSYPKWLADHIAKNLARKLASEDEERLHFDIKYDKWLAEIYVNLEI